MVTQLGELELSCIDRLTREELLRALQARRQFLPAELQVGWEQHSLDHLRLLLLTARLIHVLREVRPGPATENHESRR